MLVDCLARAGAWLGRFLPENGRHAVSLRTLHSGDSPSSDRCCLRRRELRHRRDFRSAQVMYRDQDFSKIAKKPQFKSTGTICPSCKLEQK